MSKFKLLSYKDEIISLYNSGSSIPEIAKNFNSYPQTVENLLKSLNLYKSYRPNQGNVRYFNKIDSNIKAYFLGYIAADGCVQNNGKNSWGLTITLHNKDRHVLELLRYEIGSEKPLIEIPSKNHVRFTLFNKELFQDLVKHGIVPRKTTVLSNILLGIPKQHRASFIVGYFDGDGYIHSRKSTQKITNTGLKTYPSNVLIINIKGTEELLIGIAEELNLKHFNLSKVKNKSVFGLTFSKKEEILKFFKLYDNLDFYLTRKYEVFASKLSIDRTISSSTI